MGNSNRKYIKALESIVYLANLETRSYWLLKAIYFADKKHIENYGRQIFGDSYIAMKQGPVPSFAYDILKDVRGDGWFHFEDPEPSSAIDVPDRYNVKPLRDPDLKLFSKSDIECLDYAYNLIKDLSFTELKEMSHDEAYISVEQDEEMSIDTIARTLINADEVLDYLYR